MPHDTDKPKKEAKTGDQNILDEARARFKMCEEAEKEVRDLALDDLKFRAGDQWPEDMKLRRKAARKPCLTINILPAKERQILNDNRQNRPAIQVNPVDDYADPDTAEVLQGMIRHIEYDSSADVAYDTALASAVRGGFGYIRLRTEFEDETSFQQVIKIDRVLNPFQIYMDPSCQKPDYSDAEFGFYFETLTKEEFKQQYPDSELASLTDWNSVGDKDPAWLSEDGVRICEYFYKDYKKDTLVRLQNRRGEVRTELKSKLPDPLPKGVTIVDERETELCTIKWCKHSAQEILEETEWAGKWIPIVPVLGDELYVDGKKVLEGMVRHIKDPMRMNNVMSSELVQAIGLAPKAPFVAATGQTENHKEWDDANSNNYSILRYDPISVAGTLVGPPQRNSAEPPIQAIAEARALFIDDAKAVTGIYDAQTGARSNETSGRAINQRKQQGEISNFHYADNLARALKFLGIQLLDLIPKIYNQPTVMRIIGEDGKQEQVKINQQFTEGEGQNAVQRIYDLTVGRYDATVSVGPSYQTKRQEAVATMLQIRHDNPQMPNLYDDILFQNMDFPGHEQMAERARKTLPPGLVDDQEGDPQAQMQKLQGQLQTLGQQHQLLTQQLNQATQIIQTKQVEQQGKVEIAKAQEMSRLEIVKMQEATKLAVAQINASKDASQNFAELELKQYQLLHEPAHELAMQQQQQAHEQNMASQQHKQALEQGDQAAASQAALASQQAEAAQASQ